VKRTTTPIALALLTAALSLPPAAAQGPPMAGMVEGKFWAFPRMRERLGLSEEQVDQLDAIFLRSRRALIDLKAEVEKRQLDLEAILDDDDASEAAAETVIDRLEEARAALGKARLRMMLKMRRVLTPDQRQALEEARRERRHRMDRPGPGGPDGPDGPRFPPPREPPPGGYPPARLR